MAGAHVATLGSIGAHITSREKLFRLKIMVTVLAALQTVFGAVGFTLFYLYEEEYVPRFRNYMEPLEDKKYTLMLFSVDFFMGIWLVTIWQPSLCALRSWIVTTAMGFILTAISFFWAIPFGYSTKWDQQLLFNIGFLFRIVEISLVQKFCFDYKKSRDQIIPFVKPRVVNTWPSRRENSDVDISEIPID